MSDNELEVSRDLSVASGAAIAQRKTKRRTESTQSSATNHDPNLSKKVKIAGIGSLLRRGSNPNKPICTKRLGLGLEIGAKRGQSGPTKLIDDVS
eukprot:scaffold22655_cov61-Attheya_sp.AAC.1